MEAAEMWSKWVEERGIEQHFGPGAVEDMHGTPYSTVYCGVGGKHEHVEGTEFENVLVDFDHTNRTMYFINCLGDWLAGRTVIVWSTMPLPRFWLEDGKKCSQMTARLTAYTKEEWERRKPATDEGGGNVEGGGKASVQEVVSA